jgi:hypothetical protein
MKTLKVKLTLSEGLLGTATSDPEIYKAHIASKAPDAGTIEDDLHQPAQAVPQLVRPHRHQSTAKHCMVRQGRCKAKQWHSMA